jgi:hypothetical protein
MYLRPAILATVCIAVAAPSISLADPPDHAPAHGYRKKTEKVEIVLDSERGVHVVVGMPGIFFEAGKFYRYFDGSWRVSAKVDGGWTVTAAGSIPHAIVKTRAHPGPAKVKRRK